MSLTTLASDGSNDVSTITLEMYLELRACEPVHVVLPQPRTQGIGDS